MPDKPSTPSLFSEMLVLWLIIILLFTSCKKELSGEEGNSKNNPPIAVAGPDQVITLPVDTILLNGSKSSDPGGMINAWQWTKLTGPASFTIVNDADAITIVKNLKVGPIILN